jgi:long-subunit acyl-CoA synthetase (AMP-forming)
VDVNGIEIATIGIWMRGGVEWVLTDIGAERYSIATVPIHDSLQEPYIAKVLQDAKVHALVA